MKSEAISDQSVSFYAKNIEIQTSHWLKTNFIEGPSFTKSFKAAPSNFELAY
jgi:hypothetical protein